MSQFVVALGLVFVIEGLVFAAFPGLARRASQAVQEAPEGTMRVLGIVAAVVGLIVIWIVRR